MPTLTSKRVAAAAGVVGPALTKKDRQILATAISLATDRDAFSIQISGAKHGVKALIYLKQPVRSSATLAAEEDGDDLEGDESDVAGAQSDAVNAAAPAADVARRAARFTVQQPANAAAAKAAKAAAKAAKVSAKAAVKDPEPSRKRKGAEKLPPSTPRIVDKNALSARSGEPRGDADSSPTSPPAKSARSSEAGSDEDEGMAEADKDALPAAQPPQDGSWATVARRRSPTAAAPASAPEQRGGASAPAPASAAELRLQVEVGRRVVNISKEIFEAAGVPVPPGYVKVKAGGLRRVFKEMAR